MKREIHVIIYFTFLALLIGTFFYIRHTSYRIGYIDNGKLIIEYKGFEEAQSLIKKKMQPYYTQLDSLNVAYNNSLVNFDQNNEKAIVENNEFKRKVVRFQDNLKQVEEMESKKQTEQIMEEINRKIEVFAEEKKYDLIIGSTYMGNVVYGNEDMDITEVLIKYINEN